MVYGLDRQKYVRSWTVELFLQVLGHDLTNFRGPGRSRIGQGLEKRTLL